MIGGSARRACGTAGGRLENIATMELSGTKLILVGGAGLIGSHAADELLAHDVREVVIYDNFVRGTPENLSGCLRDPRVRVFDIGGDILQTDVLDAALDGAD